MMKAFTLAHYWWLNSMGLKETAIIYLGLYGAPFK